VKKKNERSEADLDAYSIPTFCWKHDLSVASYYQHRPEMPDEIRVGNRVLITREAAAKWRAKKAKKAEAAA
jgi:hypothetical protein